MIFPFPQFLQEEPGELPADSLTICGDMVAFARFFLTLFWPIPLTSDEAVPPAGTAASVCLTRTDGFSESGYRLSVGEEVCLSFSATEGLRNALSSLVQLLERRNNGYVLRRAVIEDFADCPCRSVMIDLARGLPDKARLREDLKRLALAKCNRVHFHLMDSRGLCYQSAVYPAPPEIRGTVPYTRAEIRELVAFCHALGMTVLPEIEFPAHAAFLLKQHPTLACETARTNPSLWAVCVGKEETYAFYDALIGEIVSLFPDPLLHIGGDELYFEDIPEKNYLCHWEECRVCRAAMARRGRRNRQELYYDAIAHLQKIVRRHGRTMILWNDQLDLSRPVLLPRDTIVEFWRIAAPRRGPSEGCSYERLTEQFRVINADYLHNYVDDENYANPEKAAVYRYRDCPPTAHPDNVIGAEICAWEYGNPDFTHYALSFTCSTAVLLDKLWHSRDVSYTASYRQALTKLVLGCDTPPDYDMTELFGSVIPPRLNGKRCYREENAPDPALLPHHKAVLSSLGTTYSPLYRENLLNLVSPK